MNRESIERQLLSCSLPILDCTLSVNDLLSDLNCGIYRVLDSIAPKRAIKTVRSPAPWFSDKIRELRHRRDKLYVFFQKDWICVH